MILEKAGNELAPVFAAKGSITDKIRPDEDSVSTHIQDVSGGTVQRSLPETTAVGPARPQSDRDLDLRGTSAYHSTHSARNALLTRLCYTAHLSKVPQPTWVETALPFSHGVAIRTGGRPKKLSVT